MSTRKWRLRFCLFWMGQLLCQILSPVTAASFPKFGPGKKAASLRNQPKVAKMMSTIGNSQCYRDHKAPLELVFLIDRTSKQALKVTPKIMEIVDILKIEYPDSRFGVCIYSDFHCGVWHSKDTCKKWFIEKKAQMEPDVCYKRSINLAEDTFEIESSVWLISSLPGNDESAGVAALLLTTIDKQLGWSNVTETDDSDINKIIFVVTDAATHCCQKHGNAWNVTLEDSPSPCEVMDNPTPEYTGRKMRKSRISPFLVLGHRNTPMDTRKGWRLMLDRMGVTYGIASMEDNKEAMLDKFKNFVSEVVYNDGPVFCTRNRMLQQMDNGLPLSNQRGKQAPLTGAVSMVNERSKTMFKMPIKMVQTVNDFKMSHPKSRYELPYFANFVCMKKYPKDKCAKVTPKDPEQDPEDKNSSDVEEVENIKGASGQTAGQQLFYQESEEGKRKSSRKTKKGKLKGAAKTKAGTKGKEWDDVNLEDVQDNFMEDFKSRKSGNKTSSRGKGKSKSKSKKSKSAND